MEPRVDNKSIQDLAMYDPVAALGVLLNIPRVPISFNAAAQFSDLTVGKIVEGDLDTTIATRTWIDNIAFSLSAPGAFSNNVFQTLWLAMLKQSPGIAVQIAVHSGPRYLVSPAYTPLENFVSDFRSRWPHGWPLFKQQSIAVSFELTGVPGGIADPNVGPYGVTMTFNGWQFLDQSLDSITADEAATRLRSAGFCVPVIKCA